MITLNEQIRMASLKMDKKEFNDWLHKQIVELAEMIKSKGIENPYEVAKTFVLNKVAESINNIKQ